MKFPTKKNLAVYVLSCLYFPCFVSAQFCNDICPPLVNGNPISSLCEGNITSSVISEKKFESCNSQAVTINSDNTFQISDFKKKGHVTIIANFYIGCNAGRRESGVFAHVAQRYYNLYGEKVTFINSLKGGSSCDQWASIYQSDAEQLYPQSNVIPKEMPITVNDINFELRDHFFTPPFGHPSYVILDEELKIRKKFIGPCCGYESFFDCSPELAKTLDTKLSEVVDELLTEQETPDNNNIDQPTPTPVTSKPSNIESCILPDWSQWSPCSVVCGPKSGIQFRYRSTTCAEPVETRECFPQRNECDDNSISTCIPEVGETYNIKTITSGLSDPRDVAFHPTPGLHLKDFSEGRSFHASEGEEAWILNGGNHSISIVAALGTKMQTSISRRDRGYYHYMIEATALSFNSVSDSNRTSDKDSFNYWAVCNDNANNYLGTKEPNYFMGPTLYNSNPDNRNTVNRLGQQCSKEEECFFLHADMLHEAPECIGITHDPETVTAYGNVYWAFDSKGNNINGQLVRFDFQQPHGPGSMDHSVASIRRYPEVELFRGASGVHAGMVVNQERRELYISNPGDGTIIMVKPDSGTYARTAREEYPIYSNRLPSFEYSIWECVEQQIFANDIDTPSGLALSPDGERLFVAEHLSGNIHVFEISSGALLTTIETGFKSIGGMDFSPESSTLHFVDRNTNSLNAIILETGCTSEYESRTSDDFLKSMDDAATELNSLLGANTFSLIRDYSCNANPIVPDFSFFDQVHNDTGYASNDTDVQGDAGMDDTAVLLANRTDCGYDSELNFDALLLGGYFCHICLPDNITSGCYGEGICTNVQWDGYVCDNEFNVNVDDDNNTITIEKPNGVKIDPKTFVFDSTKPYRFIIKSEILVSVHDSPEVDSQPVPLAGNECGCANKGPLEFVPNEVKKDSLYLHSSSGVVLEIMHAKAVPEESETDLESENETSICKKLGRLRPNDDNQKDHSSYLYRQSGADIELMQSGSDETSGARKVESGKTTCRIYTTFFIFVLLSHL